MAFSKKTTKHKKATKKSFRLLFFWHLRPTDVERPHGFLSLSLRLSIGDDWRCATVQRSRVDSIEYCQIMRTITKLIQIKDRRQTFYHSLFDFLRQAINKIALYVQSIFQRHTFSMIGHFVMTMHTSAPINKPVK